MLASVRDDSSGLTLRPGILSGGFATSRVRALKAALGESHSSEEAIIRRITMQATNVRGPSPETVDAVDGERYENDVLSLHVPKFVAVSPILRAAWGRVGSRSEL